MLKKFALLSLLTCCYATPPPGYVKPPETDKYPPKYEYGYTIQDNKGSGQGKLESRDGVFSLGRYYVQLGAGPKGASQNVQYVTDEWGYHPFVEYSSIGDHSQTSASFAIGEKAVEALRNNANSNKNELQKQTTATSNQPNPTQATHLPQPSPIKPTPTAAPPNIHQAPPIDSTQVPKIQFQNNQIQESIPFYQNAIPMQYYFQSFGLPQPQYLIQQQHSEQQLPQPQFLIQNQNNPQTQFLIPLYQNALDQLQNQGTLNILSTQQPIHLEHQQIFQEVKQESNTNNGQKESFAEKETDQNRIHVGSESKQIAATPQYSEGQNNQQYLVEVKPEGSNNQISNNQNVVFVTHNSGEQQQQQLQQHNNQIVETSTARYIEEQKKENKEIENLVQAIQNDLHLQQTEPLFGNAASEVRYSDSNSISSNNRNEKTYDESILNYENPGGYGSRINTKKIINNPNVINQDNNLRLIDRTRNLVTGVDVLNINDAATEYIGTTFSENSAEKQKTETTSYGFNENVPNTILEAVTNFNNKNNDNKNVLIGSLITTGSLEIQSETQHQNNLITSSSTYSAQNDVQNSRNKLLEILNSEKVIQNDNHISLNEQPIVVADFEENHIQSSTETIKDESISDSVYSTTQNTIETKITSNNIGGTETPIIITPRPVSNNFLAPITAAISLQNSEQDLEQLRKDIGEPESSVEIQKSVPYYLGKIESYENSQQSQSSEEALSTKLFIPKGSNENESVEQAEFQQDGPKAEALIQTKSQNSLDDQQPEQGQIAELKQNLYEVSEEEYSSEESKVENKPIEITRYVDKPYPIQVPIGIPYPVEKQVPIEVERIVEKPVHITQFVEKQVPVPVPQPYKVEVERIVEKQIKVPVEITKYVDKPYPVHVPYPQPIAIPVEVERLVQTVVKEPYPVPVEVPVEVQVKVPVPHPVQVTKYIDKPYPVEKIVEKPYPVEKIVEKPVTKYIEKPYPVAVHVPVPHPVAVPVEIKVPQPYPVEVTKYIDKPYAYTQNYAASVPHKVKVPFKKPNQPQYHQPQYQQYAQQFAQQFAQQVAQPSNQHPVTKLVQIPVGPIDVPQYYDRPLPLHINYQQQLKPNPYLYAPQYQIDWKNVLNNCYLKHGKHLGDTRFAKIQDYIGLVPPQKPNVNIPSNNQNFKRKPRNSFGQNLRVEYGFKPPLIPSIQTDEFGMPLNKEEK